ncbi:MalM family protein [Chromohalobacter israelensis]|uniref:MalM family protein n=1 Tax=Chromohalobacter israelensis TaxID=141390 RepID=UPI00240C83C4|nr:MalM family protein [Chromohalobacter israelensis]MDF9434197.1 MalM family protein [Chromohalobacter israelensis]
MFLPRLTLTALCAALLAGCAASAERPSTPADDAWLTRADDCCTAGLGDLPATAVDARQSLTLRFGPDTPVHAFAGGKAPFHLLALPHRQGPLRVTLTSQVTRDADGEPQVFAPVVVLLDARGEVQRRFDWREFEYHSALGFQGDRLTLGFAVSPGTGADRVLITTSDEALAARTELLHPARIEARARHLAEPPVVNPKAAHRASGEVRVEVRPLGEATGILAPLIGDDLSDDDAPSVIEAPRQTAMAAGSTPSRDAGALEGIDFRRLIRAALAADDIALAMELAERAERAGHAGTRAWLAEQLEQR